MNELYYLFRHETVLDGDYIEDNYFIVFPGSTEQVEVHKSTYYDVLQFVDENGFKQIGETVFNDNDIGSIHIVNCNEGYRKFW